ncbi:hypothetical protein [Rhodopseudomonas sp. P2A-2r]|uniref:hypothetical protein n=1 Tax=unclassified Rhodopseudomonas TaxID=2638247 RepID=UPI002233EFD8|nr:hypothetical protein [Rhodopseudomonas sp. P2A-2r]UZE49512.1 hypothetical protein ONR75_01265 [Rhodopseudomonas sp. P2A-2r]
MLCAMLVVLQAGAALSQTLSGDPGSPALLTRQGGFVCQVPPRSTEPFDPPTTSALPGAESFVVRQHFRLDTAPAADVALSWLGATFMQRYGGKIENGVAVAPLQIFTLGVAARDREIMAALAGRHETELGAIWCSLRMQAHGEGGALLTTAVPNVFYARDPPVRWPRSTWFGAAPDGRSARAASRASVVGPPACACCHANSSTWNPVRRTATVPRVTLTYRKS